MQSKNNKLAQMIKARTKCAFKLGKEREDNGISLYKVVFNLQIENKKLNKYPCLFGGIFDL